jgi:hypothetical protein
MSNPIHYVYYYYYVTIISIMFIENNYVTYFSWKLFYQLLCFIYHYCYYVTVISIISLTNYYVNYLFYFYHWIYSFCC